MFFTKPHTFGPNQQGYGAPVIPCPLEILAYSQDVAPKAPFLFHDSESPGYFFIPVLWAFPRSMSCFHLLSWLDESANAAVSLRALPHAELRGRRALWRSLPRVPLHQHKGERPQGPKHEQEQQRTSACPLTLPCPLPPHPAPPRSRHPHPCTQPSGTGFSSPFAVVSRDRTRQRAPVERKEPLPNCSTKLVYLKGGRAREQIAQRGSGGSVRRDHQSLTGCSPGQSALADPAPAAGLD